MQNRIDNTTSAITPLEADRLVRERRARLLDVRSATEYGSIHIPGSYNVPLDQIAEHARELASVAEPVILVCRSGARATKAQAALATCGMPNAVVLTGGMVAWEAAKLSVRRGEARWDLERQVRFVAGLIVALTTLAGFLIHPIYYLFAGAIGAGLVVAAVTNTCLMGMLLLKLPYNRSVPACPVGESVSRFVRHETSSSAT